MFTHVVALVESVALVAFAAAALFALACYLKSR
jgi:hypothetical protein